MLYDNIFREYGENTMTILGAGGMAGVLSWVFTYPQDVIKTRLQADGFGSRQKYSGASNCLKVRLYSYTTLIQIKNCQI